MRAHLCPYVRAQAFDGRVVPAPASIPMSVSRMYAIPRHEAATYRLGSQVELAARGSFPCGRRVVQR